MYKFDNLRAAVSGVDIFLHQFARFFVDHGVEAVHFFADFAAQLFEGHDPGFKRQRRVLAPGHFAEYAVAFVERIQHLVEALFRSVHHLIENDIRRAAVRRIVEEHHRALCDLHRVFRLEVALLQRNGRQRYLAVGHIRKLRIQVDASRNRRGNLVGVDALKRLAYVRFFSDDVERGHHFTDSPDIDVLVRVAFVLFCNVVGIEQSEVIVPSFCTDAPEFADARQHAGRVAFFIAHGGKYEVAFEIVEILRNHFHKSYDNRIARLHVEQPASEQILTGFQVGFYGRRQFDLFEFFGQLQRLVGVFLEVSIIGHTDAVRVTDHQDRLVGLGFTPFEDRNDALASERIVLDVDIIQIVGIVFVVVHFSKDAIHLLGNLHFARCINHAERAREIQCDLFDSLGNLFVHVIQFSSCIS